MSTDPMSAHTIDDFFQSLEEEIREEKVQETYPGSRHPRRLPPPPPASEVEWDKNSYVKIIKGRRVEMFTIGALAKALRRSPNSIRSWIRQGYIPQAPFRLPSQEVNGKMVPGRRLYTREMVESAIALFAARGLLTAKRVEWQKHQDLPGEIQRRWTVLHEEVTQPH